MFGLLFIVIGAIIILQYYGVVGVFTGLTWGLIFIILGVLLFLRAHARRERRRAWIAEHRRMQGQSPIHSSHPPHTAPHENDNGNEGA